MERISNACAYYQNQLFRLLLTPFCINEVIRQTRLNKEQIAKYQEKKLKKIVKHSYENVWYYNQLFKKVKITPSDIKSISDANRNTFDTTATGTILDLSIPDNFSIRSLSLICDGFVVTAAGTGAGWVPLVM